MRFVFLILIFIPTFSFAQSVAATDEPSPPVAPATVVRANGRVVVRAIRVARRR